MREVRSSDSVEPLGIDCREVVLVAADPISRALKLIGVPTNNAHHRQGKDASIADAGSFRVWALGAYPRLGMMS